MSTATTRQAITPAWFRRWIVGLMAGLLALGAAGGAWAPKANAQGGIGEAIIAAKTADELCKLIYGEGGGLADCAENIIESGLDVVDLARCVGDDLTGGRGDEDGEDSGGDGGSGDDSEGGDDQARAKSGFEECLEELTKDDEEDEETQGQPDDLSLYRMSSALTSFYVNNLVPGGYSPGGSEGGDDEGDEDGIDTSEQAEASEGLAAWSSILGSPSTAGGFLANPDQDFLENRNWLLGSGDANNDAVFSYSSFERPTSTNSDDDDEGAPDSGVGEYAYYGAALTGMGFDSTAARDSAATAKSSVMGTGILFAYVAAGAVDTIFDTVVSLLQTLNPFRLITDWVGTNERNSEGFREGSDPRFTEGMPSEAEGTNGAFDGLKEFLGTMYSGFINLGWLVTIPIFIGVFFFGVLMSRRYMVGDGFKKLALRIGFLVVGIPLLGVTYTGALESMEGASGDAGTANASKVVGSTYLDFEKWVDSRLALPSDTVLTWDIDNNRPSDTTQAQARDSALTINAQNNPAFNGLSDDTETGNDEAWFSNVTGRDQEDTNPRDTYTATLNLLNRYISGQSVSSASYESAVKAAMSRLAQENDENASTILGWVQDFTSADSIAGMTSADVEAMQNPLIQVSGDTAMRAAVHSPNDREGARVQFRSPAEGEVGTCTPSTVVRDGWDGGEDVLAPCAMSPLQMFNYLNSDFGSSQVTTFSPTSTSSGWTREMHASVNAIGSGMMSYVYWFSAMTLLSSFALIGFIYGLALLFGSIKKGIQLIAAIPFALVGMLPGIAKAISYTIAMFLEIFMTIFVYKVIQEFMMAIPGLIERPLVDNLSNVDEGTGNTIAGGIMGALMLGIKNPTTVVMIVTLVASIGIIIFTIMAVKLRSTLIQAMDEAVTGVINKLTGTQTSAASDPAAGGGVKQGLARGASMGATHAMISGGKGGDSDGGDADGSGTGAGGDGPDGTGNGGAGMAPVAGGVGGAAMGDGTEADAAGISDADADVDGTAGPMAGPGMELPQGDYDVDADGTLRDADGNPMVDADGNAVGLSDVTSMDSDGYLTDPATGQQITDHNGQPIHSSEVGGIDANGNLTDSDGAPILDGNDQPIGANMAGVETLGGQGDTMNGATSAQSDQELADQVAAQGGLSSEGVGMAPAMVGAGAAAGSSGAGATNVGGTHGGADVSGAVDNVAGRMAGSDNATAAALGNAVQGTSAQAPAGGAPVQGPVPQRSLGDNLSTLGQQATQAGRESGVYQQYGTQGAQQAAQSAAPQAPAAQQPNVQQVSNNVPVNNGGGNDSGPGFGNYLAAGVVGAGVNKVVGGGQSRTQRTISESMNGGRGGGQQGGQGKPGTQGAQQAMRRSPRGGRGRVGSGMGMAAGMAMGQNGQGSGDGGQQGQQGQGEQPGQQGPRRGAPRNGAPSDRNQWGGISGGETGNA